MNSQNPSIDAREFWAESRNIPAIDVRTPGEFDAGHIPNAINVPLFTDDERATVGNAVCESGARCRCHGRAFDRGSQNVGTGSGGSVDGCSTAIRFLGRSSALLARRYAQPVDGVVDGGRGFEAKVLEGGYKSFRNLAQGSIDRRWNLHVVSGLTGAGKTRILTALHQAGEQTCDLEALANHRGSAYGGIAQGDQPSTEQFENDLFACLDGLDPARRIWVEDEGNRIGRVVVPQTFYDQVRHAPAVFLDVDVERRVDNLMGDYQQLPVEGLVEATQKIRKRLGGQKTDHALAAIEAGDLQAAVETTLSYYDRTYTKAANKMPRAIMESLVTNGLNDDRIVDECLKLAETFESPAESAAEGSRL